MRLDVAANTGFVNIHLLVIPEDPKHVEALTRFLSRLRFEAFEDTFDCTRADLIRLGKRADPSIRDDSAALEHGATQYKVNFTQLREAYRATAWARENIRIAVAGGSGDGTSGVGAAADAVVRQEIEAFADIIFASSSAQREFWLGERNLGADVLRERYGGLKPCLHGSDAHEPADVGKPYGERYSWIKGALTFDALRQACIEPSGRAYVGPEPPPNAPPSQVISTVEIENADWAATPQILLNPGLVTIIGARGSGKTALAEMIAAGCDAVEETVWKDTGATRYSFLARARPLLGDAQVCLHWGGGDTTKCTLDGRDTGGASAYPRARYLSQQFVEDLCSPAHGLSDSLVAEIERVIFQAHDPDSQDGALDFRELRERRTERFQQARVRESDAIASISTRIGEEFEKERLIPALEQQISEKEKLIAGYKADLGKLVIKGSEKELACHGALQAVAQAKRTKINTHKDQRHAALMLQDEVKSMRANTAPEMLRDTQTRHSKSGLDRKQWADFLLDYKGPVDESLAAYIKLIDNQIDQLTGAPPTPPPDGAAYIAEDKDPESFGLATINAELKRLEGLLNAGKEVRNQYSTLSNKITEEERGLRRLQARLTDHKGAAERRKKLQADRAAAYERVFDAIIGEEKELTNLYAPLKMRIEAVTGTLRKLEISVFRRADAATWATYAEENLIDRRREGDFRGIGSLVEKAEVDLKNIWETGSAAEVKDAMSVFIERYQKGLLAHAPVPPSEQDPFRTWLGRFARWLFNTDHVSVHYGISYDGVDITNLSPGTRGIVLLLLYLALDDDDDRPLIIDQPEENLDPKSVYHELVPLFIAAKQRRQVIMVTHNANLVINTGADQIIVAEAGPHADSGLPRITYRAAGLENEAMRAAVCDILEGGVHAFRERARRLRVRLER